MRAISFFQKKQIPEKHLARREYCEKKKNKKLFLFILIFFLILIFGTIWLIFFSPYLKIKFISFEIKDYPLVKIDENELKIEINKILSEKFYFLTFDNILFFPKEKINNFLLSDKKIEKFEIKRKFPNEIKIKIFAWQPIAIFSWHDRYSLLNKNGEIIKDIEIGEAILTNLPIIYNKTEKGMAAIPFISLFDFLKKTNGFNFKINSIEIIEEKNFLTYQGITSEKWKIYFDPNINLNEQINNLQLVIQEKISDRKNLQYIDLRFGNRVFYK